MRKWSSFFLLHVAVKFFPTSFIKETVFSLLYILASFVRSTDHKSGFISGLSILFHWSSCLFLCQYQPVLITEALYYSLKPGSIQYFFLIPFINNTTDLIREVFQCCEALKLRVEDKSFPKFSLQLRAQTYTAPLPLVMVLRTGYPWDWEAFPDLPGLSYGWSFNHVLSWSLVEHLLKSIEIVFFPVSLNGSISSSTAAVCLLSPYPQCLTHKHCSVNEWVIE